MGPIASELKIEVRADDIDHMGHVNNAVYLVWVQAVVMRHWEHLATRELFASRLWIARRHVITYRRPAYLGDDVVASTTTKGYRGMQAMFRTVIRRGCEVLAEIDSTWVCLDAVSLRPARIDGAFASAFLAGSRNDVSSEVVGRD